MVKILDASYEKEALSTLIEPQPPVGELNITLSNLPYSAQFIIIMVKRSEKSKKKTTKRDEEDIELDYGFTDEEPAVKTKLSLASTISIDPAVFSTDASTDPAVFSTDVSTDSNRLKPPISDVSTTIGAAFNRDALKEPFCWLCRC